jgi:uncharacterized membrane protein
MAALVKTWTFRSASNPSKAYETQLHSDNTTSCNCKGWCIARGGLRSCKHTRWVEQGVADRYSDGVWENPNHQRVQEQIRTVHEETKVSEKKSKTKAPKEKVSTSSPARRVVNWM